MEQKQLSFFPHKEHSTASQAERWWFWREESFVCVCVWERVCLYMRRNGSGEEGQRKTGVECLFRRAPTTPAATLLSLFIQHGLQTQTLTWVCTWAHTCIYLLQFGRTGPGLKIFIVRPSLRHVRKLKLHMEFQRVIVRMSSAAKLHYVKAWSSLLCPL